MRNMIKFKVHPEIEPYLLWGEVTLLITYTLYNLLKSLS